MNFIIAAPIAGIFGAFAMICFLYVIHGLRIANGDMLTATGSFFTRQDNQKSFFLGLIIHFLLGIFFAYVYIGIWMYIGVFRSFDFFLLGMLFGFGHGVAFSCTMVVLVAEHHPLARFRQVGFKVALGHLLAHTIYGIVVGITAKNLLL